MCAVAERGQREFTICTSLPTHAILLRSLFDLHRHHYEEHVQKAIRGDYDHWMSNAFGALALIVLTVSQHQRSLSLFSRSKCFHPLLSYLPQLTHT